MQSSTPILTPSVIYDIQTFVFDDQNVLKSLKENQDQLISDIQKLNLPLSPLSMQDPASPATFSVLSGLLTQLYGQLGKDSDYDVLDILGTDYDDLVEQNKTLHATNAASRAKKQKLEQKIASVDDFKNALYDLKAALTVFYYSPDVNECQYNTLILNSIMTHHRAYRNWIVKKLVHQFPELLTNQTQNHDSSEEPSSIDEHEGETRSELIQAALTPEIETLKSPDPKEESKDPNVFTQQWSKTKDAQATDDDTSYIDGYPHYDADSFKCVTIGLYTGETITVQRCNIDLFITNFINPAKFKTLGVKMRKLFEDKYGKLTDQVFDTYTSVTKDQDQSAINKKPAFLKQHWVLKGMQNDLNTLTKFHKLTTSLAAANSPTDIRAVLNASDYAPFFLFRKKEIPTVLLTQETELTQEMFD